MHGGFRELGSLCADRRQATADPPSWRTEGPSEEVLDPANHRVRQAVLHRNQAFGDLARQPPTRRARIDRAVQRVSDQCIADAEVADELVAVLPVEVGVPHTRVRQGHGGKARVERAQAVLDVVPSEEHRHRQADCSDYLRWDQTGPPRVVLGVDPLFLPVLQLCSHRVAHSPPTARPEASAFPYARHPRATGECSSDTASARQRSSASGSGWRRR